MYWIGYWQLKPSGRSGMSRFRAGIEENISTLKRVFSLDRCKWRGLEHFKAYMMSAVMAYNFKVFAKLSRQA
jgi:IS5 family transposase